MKKENILLSIFDMFFFLFWNSQSDVIVWVSGEKKSSLQ